MVKEIDLDNLPGQIYTIKGNEPILINDPQTLWLLRTGAIAIFTVTVQNKVITGNRRYLFTCEPDEVIFGTIPSLGKTDTQLLAVPIGETKLLKIDRAYFNHLVAEAKNQIATWVETWLSKIKFILSNTSIPPIQTKARQEGRFSLSNGQTFQPEANVLIWIKIQQGYLRWLGREELTITKETPIIPLNDFIWLEADGTVQLITKTTINLEDSETILLGISQLHKLLLNYIEFQIIQECDRELQRLNERENLNQRITATALSELASPLMSSSDNFFTNSEPLLLVAGAVGKALGVAIKPPAASENLSRVKEPLEAIARASRLRLRQVLLRDDVLQFALFDRFLDLFVIILMEIAIAFLGMLTPYATGILIDQGISDSDRGLVLQIGAILVVGALATALFRLTQGFFLLRAETISDASTQAAVWDRLLHLPVFFFRQYTTGDLQSRVTSVSGIRRQLGGNTFIQIITGLFGLLNLLLLFYYSFKLTLVALVGAVIIVIVTTISAIFLLRRVRPLLEIESKIFGQIVQLINGIAKLRIAGAENRAFAAWSKNYSQQIQLELSTQLVEDIVILFNTVMPTILSGVLFWFTFKLLTETRINGTIGLTVGAFLAFHAALRNFLQGITTVSNTSPTL